MKKKVAGMVLALVFLLGSSMTVCAEETEQEQVQPPAQNYQQIMTPEILASFTGLTMETEGEEAFTIIRNALVLRTDVWGELQDEDGDGIDDRDPINGCGYLDLNYNGFDDRFEVAMVNAAAQEDPMEGYATQMMLNMMTHRCRHGIIYSTFSYDEEIGYISMPDYFDKCDECAMEWINLLSALDDVVSSYL